MTDPRSTHAAASPSTASAQAPAAVPGHAEPSTASHWAEWQRRHAANPTRWTEWSDHPTILAALQQLHFGDAATSPMAYLLQRYPQFTQAHALSLCCGDGSTEKALVRHGVFRSMVGVDLTAERVRAAGADLGDLADRLRFEVGDVNLGDYGQACCDVVFAKASLHHVERLEAMAAGVQRCLRPGGRLVTLDFFGPTRFQWTDAQLAHANAFLAREVPPELRLRAEGGSHDCVQRPTLQAMIELDPSEAVRSGELYAFLQRHFELELDVAVGGTLLQLIFDGSIVNNFDPEDPQHRSLLERAVRLEHSLIAAGELPSDFRLIVARPRS